MSKFADNYQNKQEARTRKSQRREKLASYFFDSRNYLLVAWSSLLPSRGSTIKIIGSICLWLLPVSLW